MADNVTDPGLALVVGGANGIGAACCEVMKARGWSILIADKDTEAGRKTAEALGGQAFALDVTDIGMIEALQSRSIAMSDRSAPWSCRLQSSRPICRSRKRQRSCFDQLMAVNLRGTFHVNRLFGAGMARRGAGSIVNLSSVTGQGSTPLNIYGPGKARDHQSEQEPGRRMGRARGAGQQCLARRHAGAAHPRA